ncbi:MAG TPA: hypothetical protein VJ927_05710 [Actinomycetota bacterium]|nr:hypothetical protein [Actinomycetota bacterium]
MHPYAIEELASSRASDLQEEATRQRRAAAIAPWDHRWRRGLGGILVRAGLRLQG